MACLYHIFCDRHNLLPVNAPPAAGNGTVQVSRRVFVQRFVLKELNQIYFYHIRKTKEYLFKDVLNLNSMIRIRLLFFRDLLIFGRYA
jgi:hypothetical protein